LEEIDMKKRMMARVAVMVAAIAWMGVAARVQAQAPAGAPAKPDSAQVKADIEKAKKDAGVQWADEAHFFCEAGRANRPDEPVTEPTKIFGRTSTITYAITTPDGIILLDSGYANDVEQVLIPGIKKLGLDPANIKDVIVMHGHADHFGGSSYLQEHFGSHVFISAADWDMMEHAPAPANGAAPPPRPGRDKIITEGEPIILGGEKIMPVSIPGHTPGAVGLIFPVKDNGKTYMAAVYGGLILTLDRPTDEGLQQYIKSIAHFKEEVKKANVQVELENHAMMDDMPAKVDKLNARKKGDPNPFVIGQASYQVFLDVMGDCAQAESDRRKE
jgi:metallo-beta-lactamase class B